MPNRLFFAILIFVFAGGVYFFSISQKKEPIDPLTQTPPGVGQDKAGTSSLPLVDGSSSIPVLLGKPEGDNVAFRKAEPLDAVLKNSKDHTGSPSAKGSTKKGSNFSLPDYLFLDPETPSPPRYFSLSVASKSLEVEYADTLRKQLKGLSGRKSLDKNSGLFYKFAEPDLHYFWMKDMNFPIDIMWISSEGKVIEIKKNLSPSTFPDKFTSKEKAQYVLEASAGFADRNGIGVGSSVDLSSVPEK